MAARRGVPPIRITAGLTDDDIQTMVDNKYRKDKEAYQAPLNPELAKLLFATFDLSHIAAIGNVFLGGDDAVSTRRNQEVLQLNGVTAILSVCKVKPSITSTIKHMFCEMEDTKEQNILPCLDPCYDFIEEALKSNGKVLVHCGAGISRSVTIVIYYIMKKQHKLACTAFDMVKQYRPSINPNMSFVRQLSLLHDTSN